jgi:23S rRNA pseudouridine1911/1915/1917 synthase
MSSVPETLFFESIVRPEHRHWTLLDSLCERFTYHSREEWEDRLARGLVTRNGQQATAGDIVAVKDKVVYRVDGYTEPPVPTHFETIFEDEEFVLVGKPAGIPVHHTGRIFYNTFTGVVRRAFGNEEMIPMHRLDRDTGGLILFAKNHDTATRFQKNLDHILLRKIYLAVVPGIFPEQEFTCNIPLREDPASEIKLQMHPRENGKSCTTIFKRRFLINSSEFPLSGPVSVVEAELITGRKHQIRAHLAALGFPIVGDRLYSHGGRYYLKMTREPLSDADFAVLGAPNQMLHAYKAFVRLPYWKEGRWFESRDFSPEMGSLLTRISDF